MLTPGVSMREFTAHMQFTSHLYLFERFFFSDRIMDFAIRNRLLKHSHLFRAHLRIAKVKISRACWFSGPSANG